MIDKGDRLFKALKENFCSDRVWSNEKQQLKKSALGIQMLALANVLKRGIEEMNITFDKEVKESAIVQVKGKQNLLQDVLLELINKDLQYLNK